MIERTAKAVYPLVNVDWDDARTIARVALQTALDAEDEALLDALVDSPTFGKLDRIDARIVIEIILKHAQGERAPEEPR